MNQTEHRHMGALSFVKREQRPTPFAKSETVVLLIPDEAKEELSSGMPYIRKKKGQLTYGLPGGGRAILANDTPETVAQTLGRELHEELLCSPEVIGELVAQLEQQVLRLAYPFLVAQWREAKQLIDILPAVVAVQEFDALSIQAQQRLGATVYPEDKKVLWTSVAALNSEYRTLQKNPTKHAQTESVYRPQVLTAAHLYFLEYIRGMPTQLIVPEVIADNSEVYRTATEFVTGHAEWQLNNGAVLPTGSVNLARITASDIEFLFGVTNSTVQSEV